MMDATLIKAIPQSWQRIDKKAFAELKEAMYQTFKQVEKEQIELVKEIKFRMPTDRRELLEIKQEEITSKYKDQVSLDLYGKPYNQLSADQVNSFEFSSEMSKNVHNLQVNPELKKIRDEINEIILSEGTKLAMIPADMQMGGISGPSVPGGSAGALGLGGCKILNK